MQIPKKFFQDKLALILSGVSALAAIISVILLLISAISGSSSSYITSYKANLGIEAFQSGGLGTILSFIIFPIVILVVQMLLCWRIYLIERRLAIGILSAGLFLILLNLVVGKALLVLH